MDASEVFGNIYATDHWKGGSGEGSTIEASAPYRRVLQHALGARDVRSVVEVGCGDWQVSGLVDWQGVRYVGVDVLDELVRKNRDNAPLGFEFIVADARTTALPTADLLVMKDVLQHWPVADIRQFLDTNRSRYRYLLLTNDIASVHCPTELLNSEVELGAWRTVDLERSPFSERSAWRFDFDVRGEWTKRVILLVSSNDRLPAWRRNTLRRRLRRFAPRCR